MSDAERKRGILADSLLFENLLPTERVMLMEMFKTRQYRASEVVFNQGDIGDSLFVITRGSVEILQENEKGQPKCIAVLEAPNFIGEMSLIDREYRGATVRAKSDSELLQLSHGNLHLFAKNHRNGFTWVVVNIARALSARLRTTNRRLVEKL